MTKKNWRFHDIGHDAPGEWFEPFRDISAVDKAEAAARLYAYDLNDSFVKSRMDPDTRAWNILAKSPDGVVSKVRLKARLEFRFDVEVLEEASQV